MTRFLLCSVSAAALAAACPANAAASADDQTTAAFVAAYGHAAPVTRNVVRPAKPPGCDCSGGGATRVSLTITPQSLVDLGAGRYALVVLEKDTMAAHSAPGAIGVAYLHRTADGWRLERRWDELAWTGDDGNPADHSHTLARGAAPPLLFEIEQQAHQGLLTTTAWAFALRPEAPSFVGFFPIGGELDADNGCDFDTCGAWTYSGAIRPAWSSASLFTVTYRGWREWPAKPAKARFVASTGFRVVGGKLMPDHWVPLPDCGDGACANGPGYPPD
jgi:hypothetical protein